MNCTWEEEARGTTSQHRLMQQALDAFRPGRPSSHPPCRRCRCHAPEPHQRIHAHRVGAARGIVAHCGRGKAPPQVRCSGELGRGVERAEQLHTRGDL
jgi:hypothetical protein